MIKTPESPSEVIIIDILTAPRGEDSMLPGPPGKSAWIGHPLTSRIAGFGATTLEIVGTTAHIRWYGLDVGDELSALTYARDVLRRNRGPVVSFGEGNYVPRMLVARANDRGLPAGTDLQAAAVDGVDLADSVTLGRCFPRLTLAETAAAYELIAPEPAHAVRLPSDPRDVLAAALRARLDTIVTLHARLHLGPTGAIAGSIINGRTSPSEATLRQAA